jgi:hypothetical protein
MSWEEHRPHLHEKWKWVWWKTHPPDVAEYSWSYLFSGGKEIRARLFCELWRYLSPDLEVQAELAFAMEAIHATSLVIDDSPYMDNAETRRGKTTLHLMFSERKAGLLCYDVMNMARSIWISNRPASIPKEEWYNLMKIKLQRLMMGQWYDMEKRGNLIELASLKTGVLFELVTETVARCAGLDIEFWRKWGNALGVLFQWTDDWLDREEDKRQGNRNAFNEAYDTTLHNYREIWRCIEAGIGRGWFERPFGKYMKAYFTETIPCLSVEMAITLPLSNLFSFYAPCIVIPSLDRSRFQRKDILQILNGNDMLMMMYTLSNHMKEDDMIRTDLWKMKESEWETVPEVSEWLDEIEKRTGWNLRSEYQEHCGRILSMDNKA